MKVRDLLCDESKWTRGVNARDAAGEETSALSETAVCWCLNGAIGRCYAGVGVSEVYERVRLALKEKHRIAFPHRWNDRTTFAKVKALVEELDI